MIDGWLDREFPVGETKRTPDPGCVVSVVPFVQPVPSVRAELDNLAVVVAPPVERATTWLTNFVSEAHRRLVGVLHTPPETTVGRQRPG